MVPKDARKRRTPSVVVFLQNMFMIRFYIRIVSESEMVCSFNHLRMRGLKGEQGLVRLVILSPGMSMIEWDLSYP
jgi:hypothetical protein